MSGSAGGLLGEDPNSSLHEPLTGVEPSKKCCTGKRVRFLLCALFIGAVIGGVIFGIVWSYRPTKHEDAPVYDVRLPLSVLPTLYTIDLNASLGTAHFGGRMQMDLHFAEEAEEILFHAIDMDISDVQFTLPPAAPVAVAAAGYTGQHDLYHVKLPSRVAAGSSATLTMEFAGTIGRGLGGFYLSEYRTRSGERRLMASTQFESTDARRAFPCFDEPAFKANFSISLTTEAHHRTVLSNMPVVGGRVVNGWQRVQFATTPRMSTYLVAYVICDFEYVESHTNYGVPVRVYASPDMLDQTGVALKAAVDSLNEFEDFFKLPYPLPKSDQIAIPNFAAGAMENWGLVTYREVALLVSNDSREATAEQQAVKTVAHELAHQWFGDITTMAWWSDLWLNEGFARFVEYIGIAAYNPTWDAEGQRIAITQAGAMALDSSQYSHAIVQAVNDPSEISSLFDSVSYDKGCSILLMLSDMLGYSNGVKNSAFQRGLQAYLQAHAYANAESADLWAALQREAPAELKVPVGELMGRFTSQMGYPVVTLKVDPLKPDVLVATQKRFLELAYDEQDPALRDSQADYKWDLRIRFEGQNESADEVWLRNTDASVDLPFTSDYILANKGRSGFYRVNYPELVWHGLAQAAIDKAPLLTNGDLAGLLDDSWTLALAGETPYAVPFSMSEFLQLQDYSAYSVWLPALTQLTRVARLVASCQKTTARLNAYMQQIIGSNMYAAAPWRPLSDHLEALLQQQLVNALVAYNSTSARAEARRLWQAFYVQGIEVPADVRDAVYRVGIEDGDMASWRFLYQRYQTTLDPAEQRRTLRALARTSNTTQLSALLDMSADSSQIPSQDQTRVISAVAGNPLGKPLAWQWMKDNWQLLYKRFGGQSFALGDLVRSVVGQMQTPDELSDARTFFAGRPLGSADRALKQAFETVTVSITWRRDRYEDFKAALASI